MKKTLLILAFALLAAVSLTFVACDSAKTPEDTNPDTTVTTDAPTEPDTEAPTEPEVPQWLHSGIRSDGSFDEGTLFIGDSLTYGMVMQHLPQNGLLGDARYMAIIGAPAGNLFSLQTLRPYHEYTCTYSQEFHGLNYADAVALAGETVTAVYYMMGTNYDPDLTAESYIRIMDHILEHCPNATVYLQLVPYSSRLFTHHEDTNTILRQVWEHYRALEEPRLLLIDTFTAIGENVVSDGIHLNEEGMARWYEALAAHALDNQIPQ